MRGQDWAIFRAPGKRAPMEELKQGDEIRLE